MADKLPYSDLETSGSLDEFGNDPEVNESDLEQTNRVVSSVSQAIQMVERDITDAKKLIQNAARITAKKQGDTPYSRASLKDQGKAYKTNISTRALATELKRAAPRLYMPILTASTLTAAELPPGWPLGQEKTQFFRETITKAIKAWRKFPTFVRGLSSEVVDYGFTFGCFTDPYQWRPHMVRMDRGFVPRGAEIMDDNLARFTLLWEYQPDELLKLARDGNKDDWDKEAVAAAVHRATTPSQSWTMENMRKFEELIREQVWDYSYEKGYKVIKTQHLFVLEGTGKVSHYILWKDAPETNWALLYEKLDAYDSMNDVVIPMVFGYGDGTIHGSWGAGQLLYDMAVQLEKVRCDSIDNLRMSNKMKLQVPQAKDASKVEMTVNDTSIIVSEAQFANNVGGIAPNPQGYIALEQQMRQWMQQIIGSYLPDIPSQPSDIKAAQINAAMAQEQEVQRDVLEGWMQQFAYLIQPMTKRLTMKGSNDKVAKEVRKKLLEGNDDGIALTPEELDLLVEQPAIQSVTDFTPAMAAQKAQFAQSTLNNPLFRQTNAAKLMASAVGGQSLVDYLVVPDGDTQDQTLAQRTQLEELTTIGSGINLPVIAKDNHWVHMETMTTPPQEGYPSAMDAVIKAGKVNVAQAMLKHYAAHYQSAVALKMIPTEQINQKKSFIATYEKSIEALQQQQAQAAQAQAQQQAMMAAAQQGQPQVPNNVAPFPQQVG